MLRDPTHTWVDPSEGWIHPKTRRAIVWSHHEGLNFVDDHGHPTTYVVRLAQAKDLIDLSPRKWGQSVIAITLILIARPLFRSFAELLL